MDSSGSQAMFNLNFWDLLRMFRRRKWYLLGVIVIVNAVSLYGVLHITPEYEAVASLRLNSDRTNVVDVEDVVTQSPVNLATIVTEQEMIRSSRIAFDVIKRLDMKSRPEFNDLLEPSWELRLADRIDELGGGKKYPYQPFEPGLINGYDSPPVTKQTPIKSNTGADGILGYIAQTIRNIALPEKPISEAHLVSLIEENFAEHLLVFNDGQSYVIKVGFRSEDSEISALAANQVMESYLNAQLDTKLETTKRANLWLSERITELRTQVKSAEQAVETYRSQAGLLKSTSSTLAESEISALNTKVIEARARATETQTRWQQAQSAVQRPGGYNAVPEVLGSALIQALRQQESEILRKKAELGREFGPMHPRMIAIEQEVNDLRAQIGIEVQKVLQGMSNEAEIAAQRYQTLSFELDSMKRRMGKLNKSEVKLRALEREASATRTLFETFLQRSRETDTQASLQEADASVISRAAEPLEPKYPRVSVVMVMALLASIGLGVGFVVLADALDSRFRSVQQLPRNLGVRALGMAPRIGKGKAVNEVLRDPGSAYTESIRRLLGNVQLYEKTLGKPVHTVAVTSLFPEEGKTSISLSLARMAAKRDQKVLIIDLDLRRPSVVNYLGLKQSVGATECLDDVSRLEECLVKDKGSGAMVLTAGKKVEDPIESLTSDKLNRLMTAASAMFDMIIIDTPPVGAAADALLIAQHVDASVLVSRWNATDIEEISWVIRQMKNDNGNLAGVFITHSDPKRHASYSYGDPSQAYNFSNYYKVRS